MTWRSKTKSVQQPVSQTIFLLGVISLCSVTVTTGLQCFECLSLDCDSEIICESIKVWLNRTLVPKRQHIEFNPDSKCPESTVPLNSTDWVKVSQTCPRSDSVCLEAPIEVETEFNGKKDSYELESGTVMKSRGIIRGCARRRFLLEQPEETIEVKVEMGMINDTLTTAKQSVQSPKDTYTIEVIHSHHVYIDQGTEESVRCLEDNCNNSKRPKRNSAPGIYGNLAMVILLLSFCV